MNCRYCGSENNSDSHRCGRCGRRLDLATARPAPDLYPIAGTRVLAPMARPEAAARTEALPEPSPRVATQTQASLFPVRELGRVVPITPFQNHPAEPKPRSPRTTARSHTPTSTLEAFIEVHQETFSFPPPIPATRARPAGLDGTRTSHAPVATPLHRVIAATLDFSMVLVALGLVAIVLLLMLGPEFFGGNRGYFFIGLFLFLSFGYKLMWAMADTESPGLRWAQLRLLNFDGEPATRDERLYRLAWSLVSIMPLGFGLVWSLLDEETLTWHDHSSQTFLTSYSEDH